MIGKCFEKYTNIYDGDYEPKLSLSLLPILLKKEKERKGEMNFCLKTMH